MQHKCCMLVFQPLWCDTLIIIRGLYWQRASIRDGHAAKVSMFIYFAVIIRKKLYRWIKRIFLHRIWWIKCIYGNRYVSWVWGSLIWGFLISGELRPSLLKHTFLACAAFHWCYWFALKLFLFCAHDTGNVAIFALAPAPPTLRISGMFHDSRVRHPNINGYTTDSFIYLELWYILGIKKRSPNVWPGSANAPIRVKLNLQAT